METVETPVEQTPEVQATPEAPKAGEAANRFAFLAKKESALQKQRADLKAQREAIESQRAEVEKLRQEIQAAQAKKGSYRTNPLALLEDNGMTYKELTDYILNNNSVSTEAQIKAIQEKIEAVERQRDLDRQESERKAQEQAQAREAQVIQEFKSEIQSFLKSKAETYELTALYDSADLVYDTVEEYFNKTSKVLSIPEACDLVEKYLEGQVEKSLKTKKLSSKFQKPETAPAEKPSASAPKRTISNQAYTASTPSLVSPKVESDRMSRALAALDL